MSQVGSAVTVLLALVYVASLAWLLLYALNAYVMVVLHRLARRPSAEPTPLRPPFPVVTVQLPIYNERYVAERLLRAVAALDYPRTRLEIQVLDDSTDDTPIIVAETVARMRRRGLDVVHLRRPIRTGFKAGALAEGLRQARGEFIAIFDADFVPPASFLRRTLPHFAPDVAVVQARWGHLNRGYSTLTVAQSLGIDGHFAVEQAARARRGLFLNFNGTAGVWRKSAIVDAGGWTHDTLTEDLDLSYRAQLRGWRIAYRPEIVCPAELPVTVAGFKSQQRRWAKGSVQTALKLLPALWRAPVPRWTKYQGSIHLTYYLIHPLMLLGVLLPLPLGGLADVGGGSAVALWAGGLFGLATGGPATLLLYGQAVLDRRWWRRAWELPSIMVFGVGVSLSTTLAVIGAFRRGEREFVRTPKFGIAGPTGSWRGKRYGEAAPWGGFAELALGLYCAVATWLLARDGLYATAPFQALYAVGFLAVGSLTIIQGFLARAAEAAPALPRTALAPGDTLPSPITPVRRSGGLGAVLVALVAAAAASAASAEPVVPATVTVTTTEARCDRLVALGAAWWRQSPAPGHPPCAVCHHGPDATRGWAASFPKLKPEPPPHARVMTLLQANAAAVARHYPAADALVTAVALTAYMTAQDAALAVSPGIIVGEPVFAGRMRALAESVARGVESYDRRCAGCHGDDVVASASPRAAGAPLELFLPTHHPRGRPLTWDASEMADLLAALTARRAGQRLGVDLERCQEEER